MRTRAFIHTRETGTIYCIAASSTFIMSGTGRRRSRWPRHREPFKAVCIVNSGSMSAGSLAICVGGNMTANTTTSTLSDTDIAFQPIADAVKAAPPAMRPAAEAMLTSLKQEVAKGEKDEKPDDGIISGLLKGLAGLVPSALSAIGSAFGGPVLGAVAGPATKAVLTELGLDQK